MRRVRSRDKALATREGSHSGGCTDMCGPNCGFMAEQKLIFMFGHPEMDLMSGEYLLAVYESIDPLTVISPVSSLRTRV